MAHLAPSNEGGDLIDRQESGSNWNKFKQSLTSENVDGREDISTSQGFVLLVSTT